MPRIYEYESMGTHWKITVWNEISDQVFKSLCKEIERMSQHFDATYSRFKKDSLVWKIAETKGIVSFPSEGMEMLLWYRKFYEISHKKLNPCIGYAISDLGYDDTYSLTPKEIVRRVPDFFDAVEIIDDTHINLKEKILFDFGALGKGYFVDRITSYLKEKGINHFLVDGSGDVYYQGEETIKVGLEHPGDASKVIGVIDMKQGAMCSSAINRRAWREYNHYIDPQSMTSPKTILATWVLAENTTTADALASLLFFVAPEDIKNISFEYCILNYEYKVKKSDGFDVELF